MSSAHSAIVLVIDRLGAGYLGPYGNTWLETPGFNQLASQAFLCEHMLVNSPDLAITYHSFWRTAHEPATTSLPRLAQDAGCHTVLVTDDDEVVKLRGAADFDELHLIKPVVDLQRPADEVEDTAFIQLIESALEQLQRWGSSSQPQLLWIHARAMNGIWDAPVELRQQFADEDDPLPAEVVSPPQEMLRPDHDPDHLLSLAHAYAGQVSVVDMGLQALLQAIESLPQREALLFAVTSPRGYPLGEHLRIGECDRALYSELLHVPAIVRFPKHEGALARTQELIQPADLFATIVNGSGWASDKVIQQQSLLRTIRGEQAATRHLILASAANQQLVRTLAWQMRIVRQDAGEPSHELYVKPDDRWEFNDVASRADSLVTQLAELARHPTSGELPTELTSPWR